MASGAAEEKNWSVLAVGKAEEVACLPECAVVPEVTGYAICLHCNTVIVAHCFANKNCHQMTLWFRLGQIRRRWMFAGMVYYASGVALAAPPQQRGAAVVVYQGLRSDVDVLCDASEVEDVNGVPFIKRCAASGMTVSAALLSSS